MSSDNTQKILTIIEDDVDLGKAMEALFRGAGYNTFLHNSAEAYLEEKNNIPSVQNKKNQPASKLKLQCFLIDVRLPSMNGLELFERIKSEAVVTQPVIFLTGHGDIDMGVSAIKNGAFDFMTKPVNSEELLNRVEDAMNLSKELQKERNFTQLFEERMNELTDRETEVLNNIVRGLSNKQISEKLKNSIRTIELHRARILKKMNATNAIELTRQYERYLQLNDSKLR